MRMGKSDFDVIVVGAGFAGLYMLHKLRQLGLSACVLEKAGDVGGTWYWNRYPGARCDIESVEYSYSFSPELEQEWQWTERYASQPEILRYLQHVADRFDLRRDIRFNTTVAGARWDESGQLWHVATDGGEELTARFCVFSTGCLSSPNKPQIEGLDSFGGETYLTGLWPHEGVDFNGKRVAVIGTGSSGIQSIPVIARQVDRVTVFQRTPSFVVPAQNRALEASELAEIRQGYRQLREEARHTVGGVARGAAPSPRPALETPPDELRRELDERWEFGGLGGFLNSHPDSFIDARAAERIADYLRDRVRGIVKDPATAELLCPTTYPVNSKRLCVDTGYFDTFNRDNVELVDLNANPIRQVTPNGVLAGDHVYDVDIIVLATGFDAMTGSLGKIDIRGRDNLALADKWSAGPRTYLGLMSGGFPNMFIITGPGSPSVLSNMVTSIEQHVEWIGQLLSDMAERGQALIEPRPEAEDVWTTHVTAVAEPTIFMQADSWYLGANVPGKPRVFMPYVGGVGTYRAICDALAADGYPGFVIDGQGKTALPDFFSFLRAPE